MKLIPKWKVFRSRIGGYIKQADNILQTDCSLIEELGYNEFLYKYNSWIFFCHCYLKYSFDDLNNEFAQSFYSADRYNEFLIIDNEETPKQIEEALVELKIKPGKLKYILRLLSVCDAIIYSKYVDLASRSEYSNQDIMDLILDKLYCLPDCCFYPFQTILRGNGINKSNEEEIQIVKSLEKRGFIDVNYSDKITVKISLEGQKYVEDERHFRLIENRIITKPYIDKMEVVNENNNHQFIVYE